MTSISSFRFKYVSRYETKLAEIFDFFKLTPIPLYFFLVKRFSLIEISEIH